MARIRSIHPKMLTDPDWSDLSLPARYMAMLSLMIADDAANFERNPRGMKMALFPGDDSMTTKKIATLTEELIKGRFYEPYEVDGKAYLHVRSFPKYQKPDHPTPPRFPLAPGQTYTYQVREGNAWITKTVGASCSTNTPRTLPEHTPHVLAGIGSGIGEERRGSGSGAETPNDTLPLGALEAPADRSQGDSPPTMLGDAMKEIKIPTAPNDRGNGKDHGVGKGNDPILNLSKILPGPKYKALVHAFTKFGTKEWSKERVDQHLAASEFDDQDFMQVEFVFKEAEQA